MPCVVGILVAEDERNIRVMVRAILHQQGFNVYEAGNGNAALQLLAENAGIDLVLSDLNMPYMNGVELLDAMRLRFPHIPLIIMSAYTESEWASDAIDRATDCLTKPFSRQQLLDIIKPALL